MINILRQNTLSARHIAQKENSYDIYLFWAIFAMLAFFMLFYFIEVNNLATIGYKIQKNQKVLEVLKIENAQLTRASAKVVTPQAINAAARNLALIGATNTTYIKPDTDLTFLNARVNQ